MSLYLFSSPYPLKAVDEFRQAKFTAFCMLCADRRKVNRHAKRKTKGVTFAWPGYVCVIDPDPRKLWNMRYIGHPVRDARGRWAVVPPRDAEWMLNPPPGLFHDDQIPEHLTPRTDTPNVKPGDTIRFTLASERHEVTALSVDGHTVLVRLAMLGREVRTRVPVHMVETVAA